MPATDLSGSSRLYISVVVAAGVCVVLESSTHCHGHQSIPMVGARGADAAERLLHCSDPGNSRETLCFGNFRFCGGPSLRPAGSHDDRRPRHTRHLILARPPIVAAVVTRHIQRRRRSRRNLGRRHMSSTTAPESHRYLRQPQPIVRLLPWLLLLATVYFLLNSWLVAIVVGLHKRARHSRFGGRAFCGCR